MASNIFLQNKSLTSTIKQTARHHVQNRSKALWLALTHDGCRVAKSPESTIHICFPEKTWEWDYSNTRYGIYPCHSLGRNQDGMINVHEELQTDTSYIMDDNLALQKRRSKTGKPEEVERYSYYSAYVVHNSRAKYICHFILWMFLFIVISFIISRTQSWWPQFHFFHMSHSVACHEVGNSAP